MSRSRARLAAAALAASGLAAAALLASTGCTFDVDRFQFVGGGGTAGQGAGGEGGSGGSGGSAGSGGQAVVVVELADGQDHPYGIATDGTHVYWANFGSGAEANGSIMRVPVDGGTPEVLVSDVIGPTEVAVDDTSVYWITVGSTGPTGGLYAAPKSGGAPVPLVEGYVEVYDLALVEATTPSRAYFTCGQCTGNTPGRVEYLPVTGGTPTVVASDQAGPVSIAAAGERVFWTNRDADGITTADSAGVVAQLTSEADAPDGIEVAGGQLYWVTSSGDRLYRMAEDGGDVTPLAEGNNYGSGITADDENVYWFDGPSVNRMPTPAGEEETFVSGQSLPLRVTLDGTHVYWTDYLGGAVRGAEK